MNRKILSGVCWGLGLLFLLSSYATAEARWIDLGGHAATVQLLEDNDDRSVVEITIGGFEAQPVDIEGNEYYLISIPREGLQKEVGLPQLPNIRRSLIIPGDRQMQVKVLESEHVDLTGMPVAPSKGYLPRTVDPAMVAYQFDDFYASGGTYPDRLAESDAPYILRDYRGMVVDANVFQYNASTQTLRVYTRMVIEMAAVGPGIVNVLERTTPVTHLDPQFAQLYQNHFLNYGINKRYNPLYENGSLLIIAYDSYASYMIPLVEWKNQKGLSTRLVTLADTGPSYTQIYNYILAEYESSDLAYVLLVGDAQHVPKYGSDSDPGYSLLAGSDSYPEIFVGRFSAESPEHVQTQVMRTIVYERDTTAGSDSQWLQAGTGIASNQGPGHYGEYDNEHMDFIREDLLGYGFTEVDRIYDPSASAAMVTSAINAGRGIVNYCGHGSTTAWSTTGFNNSNVNALVNDGLLPFIASVACNNGTFTNGTCFAESWMRATHNGAPTGAIACYMSYISQSWDPPMYAQDEAVDLLIADVMRTVGGLWFNGSCEMMDMTGSIGQEEFRNWTIFGDPSLAVRTKTAAEMPISHIPVVPLGSPSFTVDIPGVEGATACLYRDGVIHGVGVTDATGHVEFELSEPILEPGEVTLTVTAYNYVTYQTTLMAIVPALVSIDPAILPVGVTTPVTVTVTDTLGVGLADVTVWISGYGQAELEQLTDESGQAFFDVSPLYGENLVVRGRENAAAYDLFNEMLPVSGASAFTDPIITAEVSAIGMVDALTPHYEGTVTGQAAEYGLTLFVSGPGIDSSTSDPANVVSINVTPTETGEVIATLAKDGYEVFTTYIPVVPAFGGLAGTVLDADSQEPIPGARVFGYSAGADTTEQNPLFDELTDGMGTFAVAEELPVGSYDIYVDKIGYLENSQEIFLSYGPNDLILVLVEAPLAHLQPCRSEAVSIPFFSAFRDTINLSLDSEIYSLEVFVDISHSDVSDLIIELTSPMGTTVRLHSREPGPPEGLYGWYPYDLIPYGDLNDFLLEDVAGDWVLYIYDYGVGNQGVLNEWCLRIVAPDVVSDTDERINVPTALTLEGNYPNPFNPATRIVYSLPRATAVDLAVYDLKGRRITTLVHDNMTAGRHEIVWRGSDTAGRQVSSGIYFYRLEADGEVLTRKMMLMK